MRTKLKLLILTLAVIALAPACSKKKKNNNNNNQPPPVHYNPNGYGNCNALPPGGQQNIDRKVVANAGLGGTRIELSIYTMSATSIYAVGRLIVEDTYEIAGGGQPNARHEECVQGEGSVSYANGSDDIRLTLRGDQGASVEIGNNYDMAWMTGTHILGDGTLFIPRLANPYYPSSEIPVTFAP